MIIKKPVSNHISIEQTIPSELNDRRLDQALAVLCPLYSRSQIQQWIRAGAVRLDNQIELKPRTKINAGQHVLIETELLPQDLWQAQAIPLKIVYEDSDLIIIDKPAGLVVHPGAGNPEHTLVNALLHYDANLGAIPRAGLVHRLDKETSGLLVVARNLPTHNYLVRILQLREIKREYQAIVHGLIPQGGVIETLIGRHPTQRTKMSVVKNGKPAVTHFHVLKRYRAHTHLHIQLETGRTHQIRVHFAHIRHPLVGDPTYGRKTLPSEKLSAPLLNYLQGFPRQALHAIQLTLPHPQTQEIMSWISPLPEDMDILLKCLEEDLSDENKSF